MESIKKQVEILIQDGGIFTRTNFCFPSPSGGIVGGKDSPEWLSWKTRSFNLISQVLSESSSAFQLVRNAVSIETEGHLLDKFDAAKATILKALQQVLEVIENDTFNELRKAKSEAKDKTLSNKIFIVHPQFAHIIFV